MIKNGKIENRKLKIETITYYQRIEQGSSVVIFV